MLWSVGNHAPEAPELAHQAKKKTEALPCRALEQGTVCDGRHFLPVIKPMLYFKTDQL